MIQLSPQWTLLAGIALSFFVKNNSGLQNKSKLWGTTLLQISVVLLGASLNFSSVLSEGPKGLLTTFISILLVFLLGFAGIKIFKLEKNLGILITAGTAICGGSAIGALAPVLSAETSAITISMAIVFLLNAVSLYLFPLLGDFFSLTQNEFGVLSALAIHDTSSVVAASSMYGSEALLTATTLKLTRALWIIPVTMVFSFLQRRGEKKITFPWFVIGFLIMSLAFTFIPTLMSYKNMLLQVSKTGFAITLFLIGMTFNFTKIKETGLPPLIFGVLLWIIVTALSLIYIKG